jgi:hypothetical protein
MTIGFSVPKKFNLFSWCIRKALETPYSHVYVSFVSSHFERKIIYQASGIAVNLIGENRFNANEDVIAEFDLPVSLDLQKEIIQSAIDTVGEPYGYKHVIGLVVYLLLKRFGIVIRVPFRNDTTAVCSELAAKVLKEFVPQYGFLDPETATPKDVYLALSGDMSKNI